MTETQAALYAAAVGALCALVVGCIAGWAALRQVAKTAEAQRKQADWQLRSEDYANFVRAMFRFRARVGHAAVRAEVSGDYSNEVRALYVDLANVAATLTMRIAADPVMDAMLKLVNCAYAVHSRVTDRRRLYLPSRDAAMDRLLEQFEDAEWAVRNAFRDDLWGGESLRRSGHAGSTGGSGG
ncbi:hypothetical protein BX257_8983 [Streptomyces sp. 3212.3]|uniref:hypothetical protein n=1 Tax=unclassified Streptomyces TaxID=2593676 RepID=UPI00074140DE|nr:MULTISPECIES: hypothetical protein [unclassified Streptomyces]REE66169.1 hypothetical protein BX257_8983 [Streptomyces sp. 3212.3]